MRINWKIKLLIINLQFKLLLYIICTLNKKKYRLCLIATTEAITKWWIQQVLRARAVFMQFSTDLILLLQIWPETCPLSVDVKPLVLMRRPGSRVIMEACDGRVSYRTNGGHRSRPRLVPLQPFNRPSELRAPLSSCLSSSLIVGRGLIYTSDKICAAAYTHKHTQALLHTLHTTAVDQWCCDMCVSQLRHLLFDYSSSYLCRNTGNSLISYSLI